MQTEVRAAVGTDSLNESPSKKEGKFAHVWYRKREAFFCLNESPSKKEGK